jgi:LAO/AO transport system kinase
MSEVASLAQRLLAGDRRALARAITLSEDGGRPCDELVQRVFPMSGRAQSVGITGPPGVGKSTLIDCVIQAERERARSVAVLSVDPSSPFTSGAILGDRLRMSRHFVDNQVFIRSMGSRGAAGGLSRGMGNAVTLADAAGWDVILVETVGAGQIDVDIVKITDSVVLVLMAGAGDSIQALKSGIMEIPDVIVINHAEDTRASETFRHVREALSLRPTSGWTPPIVKTQASTGEGVGNLQRALGAHRDYLASNGHLLERRREIARGQIAGMVMAQLAARVECAIQTEERIDSFLSDVAARRKDPVAVAQEITNVVTQARSAAQRANEGV